MDSISANEIIQAPGEEYDLLKEAIKQEMHCAMPGIVQSYNSADQTVTVELAVRSVLKSQSVRPPILSDVPVFFPGGRESAITFPVAAGDECLVVFADVCIDSWFQNGGSAVPISVRKHDLSDGFAFVGFRSRQNALANVSGLQGVTKSALLDLVYPVGAVYQSTVSTNPAVLFGGTWETVSGATAYCWARVG